MSFFFKKKKKKKQKKKKKRRRRRAALGPTVPGDVVLHVAVASLPRRGDTKLQVESHAV